MLCNKKPHLSHIFDILISCFGVDFFLFYDPRYLHRAKISTRKVSNIPIPHGHPNFQNFPLIIESHLITILMHFQPISLSSKATWKKMTLSLLCCSICEFIKTFLLWLRLLLFLPLLYLQISLSYPLPPTFLSAI